MWVFSRRNKPQTTFEENRGISPSFSGGSPMSSTRSSKRSRSRRPATVHKPKGAFHSRVQQVGAEHFGIVCVDAAKRRSKWMLADFFGTVLVPPTFLDHTRSAL